MAAVVRTAGAYVACYVLWLLSAALGLASALVIRRAVEQAYVALQLDKWGLAWASHSATVVLGVAWLAIVAWTETAYRHGVRDGRLWRRFAVVTLIEAAPLSLLLWDLALT